MGSYDDIDMVLIFGNFKNFLRNKALAKKGEKRNEELQCLACKGFGISVQTM